MAARVIEGRNLGRLAGQTRPDSSGRLRTHADDWPITKSIGTSRRCLSVRGRIFGHYLGQALSITCEYLATTWPRSQATQRGGEYLATTCPPAAAGSARTGGAARSGTTPVRPAVQGDRPVAARVDRLAEAGRARSSPRRRRPGATLRPRQDQVAVGERHAVTGAGRNPLDRQLARVGLAARPRPSRVAANGGRRVDEQPVAGRDRRAASTPRPPRPATARGIDEAPPPGGASRRSCAARVSRAGRRRASSPRRPSSSRRRRSRRSRRAGPCRPPGRPRPSPSRRPCWRSRTARGGSARPRGARA